MPYLFFTISAVFALLLIASVEKANTYGTKPVLKPNGRRSAMHRLPGLIRDGPV